jgi:hypothetical protein
MKKYLILSGALIIAASACNKDKEAIKKPQISLKSMSPNTVVTGAPGDTVFIELGYAMAADGIGIPDQGGATLILEDSRDTSLVIREPFPADMVGNLPEGEINISGTLTMKLPAISYLILEPDRPDGDTLKYTIYLKDKNGVESNRIETSDIFILP